MWKLTIKLRKFCSLSLPSNIIGVYDGTVTLRNPSMFSNFCLGCDQNAVIITSFPLAYLANIVAFKMCPIISNANCPFKSIPLDGFVNDVDILNFVLFISGLYVRCNKKVITFSLLISCFASNKVGLDFNSHRNSVWLAPLWKKYSDFIILHL